MDKHYIVYGGVGVLAVLLLLMLHNRAPLTASASQPGTPQNNINLTNDTFSGPNLGDISLQTPTQLALNLSFPSNTYTTSSCDCGCDANSPINTALQQVALTIQQYQAGVLQVTDKAIQAAQTAIPDWLGQYINSGGMSAAGNGGV